MSINAPNERTGLLPDKTLHIHHQPVNWEFPGWGSAQNIPSLAADDQALIAALKSTDPNLQRQLITIPRSESMVEFVEPDEQLLGTTDGKIDLKGGKIKVNPVDTSSHTKINQWLATAICGNDITASIFYTASVCTLYAGKWAPVSLAIVCVVLYFFRKVYGEVGTALPLNGGAYNVLLNTTTKGIASFAACLTLISYIATAVVSASTAVNYLSGLLPQIPIYWCTIGLLGFFALLNIIGIGESAMVALLFFIIHMGTLTVLVVSCAFNLLYHGDFSVLIDNWNAPSEHSFAYSIYFGFGAAMLGISGFETSSNFIEQQQEGVFPKTLRNMWITVTLFNPIVGLLALMTLPIPQIISTNDGILSLMGRRAVGEWLAICVGADAFLVLSGSIITSYVGVTGLARRMALDRCLPQFLLHTNRWTNTNHWIILIFFVVCSSLYTIVNGDTTALAGVYTLAFLGVMTLFATGNMLLKYKRSSLPRQIRASWTTVLLAWTAVVAGLVATIIANPKYIQYFSIYFIITALVISVMFLRIRLLKVVLFFAKKILKRFANSREKISSKIGHMIQDINSQCVIFFASKDDPDYLNKAILYVRDNELTSWIKVIHVYENEVPRNLAPNVEFLDHCYPKIRIDLITVQGIFCPETVEKLSQVLQVQKNFMFIACPKNSLPHSIASFGGVRMITH